MEQELTSKVWQLGGWFGSITPGYLLLRDGKVTYLTKEGERFQVPLAEVKEVRWPLLQMGFGFYAMINGKKYRFTFMKPENADDIDGSRFDSSLGLDRLGQAAGGIAALAQWGDTKKIAKAWKEVLEKNA